MNTNLLSLILAASVSLPAFGLDNNLVYTKSMDEARQITKELCSSAWPGAWGTQLIAGARHSYTADEFNTLPPELQGLLDSDGFEEGLTDCFGQDRDAKDRFVMALLFASSAARFAGLYGPMRAIGAGTRGLVTGGKWVRTTKWALENPRLGRAASLAMSGLGHGTNIGLAGLSIFAAGAQAFTMFCEQNEKCFRWMIRRQLPSQSEMRESLGANNQMLAEIGIPMALGKLEADKTELARIPDLPEFAQERARLKAKIAERTANIRAIAKQVGLPEPKI